MRTEKEINEEMDMVGKEMRVLETRMEKLACELEEVENCGVEGWKKSGTSGGIESLPEGLAVEEGKLKCVIGEYAGHEIRLIRSENPMGGKYLFRWFMVVENPEKQTILQQWSNDALPSWTEAMKEALFAADLWNGGVA